MVNTNKQLSVVFEYVYTAEIKEGELELKSNEDMEKYKEQLQEELKDLFFAEDGRAETGTMVDFKMEVK